MADVRFVSNQAALNAVLNSASRRAVTTRAQEVLNVAKAGEGTAKDTLGYTVEGAGYRDISARVGSNDPEVLFEEGGTKPHIIRARNARVLKFPGTNGFGGKMIYTALVHHPGTKGRHVLRNALRTVMGR